MSTSQPAVRTRRRSFAADLELLGPESRLGYLDNLRIALITLVVLHHVAMAYGAAGLEFYFVQLPPEGFSRNLLVFVLGNQAWFMGAFFLIAGYFTPGSYDRKGPGRFAGSRMLRLGVPLLAYALLLNPLSMLAGSFMADELNPMSWETFRYFENVRMGPMWFVALLLIFSLGYSGWRLARGSAVPRARESRLGYPAIGGFAVLLAAVTYILRTQVQVGETVWGFPSLAYLPQYAGMFVAGALAYRRDWLRTLPVSKGWAGFGLATAAAIFVYPLAFSGQMFSLELSEALGNAFSKDGHWQMAAYVAWDSLFVIGMCLALVVLFRQRYNRQGRLGRELAKNSYAVYVLHIPVVVYLAVLLTNVDLGHTLELALAALLAIPLCFVAAALVRRIPGVAKVL